MSIKIKDLYCPFCLKNRLTMKIGEHTYLFFRYKCKDCNEVFDRSDAVKKDIIRDKKINNILNVL